MRSCRSSPPSPSRSGFVRQNASRRRRGRPGPRLQSLCNAIGRERVIIALDSKDGRIVIKGWWESTDLTTESVLVALAPYYSGFLCTYVDKEGMMGGTGLEWFRLLRAATPLEITAAGGITTLDDVRALMAMEVHCVVGMAIYKGRLSSGELAGMLQS